jgi:rubrerythrin
MTEYRLYAKRKDEAMIQRILGPTTDEMVARKFHADASKNIIPLIDRRPGDIEDVVLETREVTEWARIPSYREPAIARELESAIAHKEDNQLACDICGHTIQNVGAEGQRIFWCPRCGSLTNDGEIRECEGTTLQRRVRSAIGSEPRVQLANFDGSVYVAVYLGQWMGICEAIGVHIEE